MGKFKKKILYHGANISAGMLALLMFALAFPMTSENSFAEPITLADNEAALLTTNIDVQSAISLAVKQQLDFEIMPHSSGSAFNKGVTTLNVNTNTDAGYNLYIHTTNEDGKLHNSREGITDTLNPIGAGVTTTSDNMPANTWGYSSDGVNYQAVPTTSTKIPGSENSTTSKTYTINIGAKIDLNIAAGKYQGNVIFSTVANPIIMEKWNWDTIMTMQQMTPEICASAPIWTSGTNTRSLLDDRGKAGETRKSYSVAKLKDGNCWMQTNLALNLGFEMTGDDTDLAPGAKITLPTTTTSSGSFVSTNNNAIESRTNNTTTWWYSWAAATAGSGTTSAVNVDGQAAPDSICPKGWQLPAGGPNYNTITKSGNPDKQIGSGSFYDLLVSYGITNYSAMISIGEKIPLNFVRAGYIYSSVANKVGEFSMYWTRISSADSGLAYQLFYRSDSNDLIYSHPHGRYYGSSVRCVARQKLR